MKKIICVMLALSMLVLTASAESIRVAALKGPTAMGMAKMITDDAGSTYDFSVCAAADEITPRLVQGELDIAAVPANLAAVLYAKTNGMIRVININTLGVLYIAEHGDTIHSLEDLRGRTIYSAGKGSTPEYVLNYLISEAGLVPDTDLTIEYKSEHAECLAAMMNDETAIAMLPQPFLTTAILKDPEIRVALDLTQEWENLSSNADTALITGVCVARSAFIDENPDLVNTFLAAYSESVAYTNSNVDEAAALIESFDIVPAPVAQKALPGCNIVFISGQEMQSKLSGYLNVLYTQNPDSTGGSLPDEDFYYISEN